MCELQIHIAYANDDEMQKITKIGIKCLKFADMMSNALDYYYTISWWWLLRKVDVYVCNLLIFRTNKKKYNVCCHFTL